MHIHTCLHTHIHTYIHTHTYIYIYIYIHIHTYIYIYIYIYIHIHEAMIRLQPIESLLQSSELCSRDAWRAGYRTCKEGFFRTGPCCATSLKFIGRPIISLLSKKGAILLFDFRAAFPSLNHSYMWDVLSAVGLPVEFVNVIRCFYKHNAHFIKVSNSLHAGPGLYAGVRQGCPLSPFIFAMFVECLGELMRDVASKRGVRLPLGTRGGESNIGR